MLFIIQNKFEKDASLSPIKNTNNCIKKEKFQRKKPVLLLVPKNRRIFMNGVHKNNLCAKSKSLVDITTQKLNQQEIEFAKRSLRMQVE